jgi:hypothetical protein
VHDGASARRRKPSAAIKEKPLPGESASSITPSTRWEADVSTALGFRPDRCESGSNRTVVLLSQHHTTAADTGGAINSWLLDAQTSLPASSGVSEPGRSGGCLSARMGCGIHHCVVRSGPSFDTPPPESVGTNALALERRNSSPMTCLTTAFTPSCRSSSTWRCPHF